MATYKRLLKDKAGNTIIPVISTTQPLGLSAFMSIKATNSSSSTTAVGTIVKFSDSAMGTKTLLSEYDPQGCIALTSGTCRYTHNGKNKLIEVDMVVSGSCYAYWLQSTNGSALSGATYIASQQLLSKSVSGFGGATFTVFFDVSGMANGATVLLNPQINVYGGAANINGGGTEGCLNVKVYGEIV